MRSAALFAAAAFVFIAQVALGQATQPLPYQNPALPIDDRVKDLLSRMTIDEKIQQLRSANNLGDRITTNNHFDPAKAARTLSAGIGQVSPMDYEVEKEVELCNGAQKYLVENVRLGIPAIFHDEACHGFRSIGCTSFPTPIGFACAWDPDLMTRCYSAVAGEMRARGVSMALAPVVDIDRDPRWGRADETLGEDPYLNGTLAAAIVRGLQGSDDGAIAPGHVAATLKHFVGHGQPEGGLNRSPGDVPLRELYDAHMVPFRIAIATAHPAAVMPSYNEVDGVPSHANRWLLQDVLRGEFKFQGLVVSDYQGVEFLADVHHVAPDQAAAAVLAFKSGVDINLPDGRSFGALKQAVEQRQISSESLDAAVSRMLRLKFSMGLFEQPYGDAKKAADLAALDSSRQLARQAALESIVLLKNSDKILPLNKNQYKTIAVIGPNAASARLGSYSGDPLYKVSLLKGIQDKLAGTSAQVIYAEGCKLATNLPESSLAAWHGPDPILPSDADNRTSIAQAVAAARGADLIILAIGENEMFSRESWATNHLGDRASLDLPGAQNDLCDAIFALNKPTIVYLMNGGPLAIPRVIDRAAAVIEGWYMGQETGNAAADILFGDANPSGKLTISIPRATGQVPDYYDYKPGARLFSYVDLSTQPLFPFGFGLSYTTFSYSTPTLSSPQMDRHGQAVLSATVTNTGAVKGDEIVEFYIRQKVSSVTRPVKELKGFQRLSLAPGEKKTVTFTINHDTLAFHDIRMDDVVEPGDVDLMIGSSSATVKTVTLKVTE